jgi:hypothetical protein
MAGASGCGKGTTAEPNLFWNQEYTDEQDRKSLHARLIAHIPRGHRLEKELVNWAWTVSGQSFGSVSQIERTPNKDVGLLNNALLAFGATESELLGNKEISLTPLRCNDETLNHAKVARTWQRPQVDSARRAEIVNEMMVLRESDFGGTHASNVVT